jgi:hypothetical protein
VTREEHKSIIHFIEAAVSGDNSVPQSPLDVEADAIIRALFVRNRDAAYRITMLAMAQAEELEQLKSEPSDTKTSSRAGLLAWLLNKRDVHRHRPRRDPRLPMGTQTGRTR